MVDDSVIIADLIAGAKEIRAQLPRLEKAVEQYRDQFNALRGKKAANENLIDKLQNQAGQCPIDCRISCDKDFSDLITGLIAENDGYEAELQKVTEQGTLAKSNLTIARGAIVDAEEGAESSRQEEISALRDNESIQTIIREYENEISKAESFDTKKEARLTAKREELAGIEPAAGCDWELTDAEPLSRRKKELEDEARELKLKIAEQTKARNALANLKSSMADGALAGYHAEAWKAIAEAVGPKGLQGELVKDILAPLTEAIQNKFIYMGIQKTFYFQTEDDKGNEIFQFGWTSEDGDRRNFDALSTGEQMLLLIAMMTTIIDMMNPPMKVLCIDNAENLDSGNLRRVLHGIISAGRNFDNIIFIGVMDINPEDYPEWRVWNLSEAAA